MSTQSAKIRTKGSYAETKARADALFLASGLDVTILRPSIVYGETLEGVFGSIHRAVSRLPIVPVLGDGRWESAPVHVDDLAGAVADCLTNPETVGRTYDVGGPDILAFDELLDRIASSSGHARKPKLHVPVPMALALARVLTRVRANPPLTVSNVLGSNQETGIDIGPARRDFGFDPMSLDSGLQSIFAARAHTDASLRAEAARFSRYLLRREPTQAITERYVEAHRRFFPGPADRLTRFCRRHPAAISLLDAATARRGSELRRRILLMAVILEASPEHADRYLPQPRSRVRTFASVLWGAVAGVARALIGLPLATLLRDR
jgi:hypothetical protein